MSKYYANSVALIFFFSFSDMVLLHQHTPENYKVCIARLVHNDPSEIMINDLFKMYLMTCDIRFHLPIEDYRKMEAGEIMIIDMKNFTFKHLTRAIISTLRLVLKYLQTAHPVRLVQLHVINCTPVINKAMLLIRPFMNSRLYNCIHFHKAGSIESLYSFVPAEILPSDYSNSGTVKMCELKNYWCSYLDVYRPFLMNDTYWKPDDNDHDIPEI